MMRSLPLREVPMGLKRPSAATADSFRIRELVSETRFLLKFLPPVRRIPKVVRYPSSTGKVWTVKASFMAAVRYMFIQMLLPAGVLLQGRGRAAGGGGS